MKQFTVHSSQFTAVLILGHGSPIKEANNTLREVAKAVKAKGGYDIVQPAFLQFERPDFAEAIEILTKQGVQKIIVHPYFLYMGAHVTKDLPFEIETAKKKHPALEIVLAPHLGYHEKMVDVAVERIEEANNQWSVVSGQELSEDIPRISTHHLPYQHPIEAESFRLIGEQLDESRFGEAELQIVKRLIHTTADFEYADLVRFGNDAIEAGIAAISQGADIIVDVRMVEVGISKERLSKFGGRVKCFVADEDVAKYAKETGFTKTAAGMKKAFEFKEHPTSHIPHPTSLIIAIGNAPTALRELIKMIRSGHAQPALVIGVPVGFVDAEESKDELMRMDVPYISIKGKKGGSTVAVAIVNALLMLTEMNKASVYERQQPSA